MKVLIADDERLITEWLEFCLNDLDNIDIVGVAKNGSEALDMYHQYQPDVILSDIKMPVMDGIQLLKKVKKINSNCYVVLLTAYSEFEYAREAIRNDADDYILKTEMNKEKIQAYFKNIEDKFNRENHSEKSNISQINHLVIKKILTQTQLLTDQDMLTLEEQGINVDVNNILAVTFWNEQIINEKIKTLNFINEKHKIIYQFESNRYMYTFLVGLEPKISEMDRMKQILEIKKNMEKIDGVDVGMSSIYSDIININKMIMESIVSLMIIFYDDEKKVLTFSREESIVDIINCNIEHDYYLSNLYQLLVTTRTSEREVMIETIFDYIQENKLVNIVLIKKIVIDMISLTYSNKANQNIDYSNEEYLEIKKRIIHATKFTKIRKLVVQYNSSFSHNIDIERGELSVSISRAMKFIEQHYHEPISLDIVADAVNLNPEYLSRMFKKEIGKTYSSFLAELRLTKAKKLLEDTNDQVQKIANSVGYFNVSYFSTLFKKEFGINPYEYRKKNFR